VPSDGCYLQENETSEMICLWQVAHPLRRHHHHHHHESSKNGFGNKDILHVVKAIA
jgi:hypothetical protein